MGRKKWNCD